MTLLAVTLGVLLIVPPIVALYRQDKRIQQAQQLAGVEPMNGWLALVLYLVLAPVFFAYEQSEINKAWAAEGGPVEAAGTQPAPALQGAPQAPATTSSMSSDKLPGA